MVNITQKEIEEFIHYNKGIPYIHKGARTVLQRYKSNHCCERCGKRHTKKDPLTFHHTIPALKKWNIGDIMYHKPIMKVNNFLTEINSCELLCRKCHEKVENMI